MSETVTMTLTEFLLARIAEDEAVARTASHQKVAGPFHGDWRPDSALLMANGALERADRTHIARHDPARVLAECEAKRRIVELHDDTWVMPARTLGDGRSFPEDRGQSGYCKVCAEAVGHLDDGHDPYPCDTIRALALPYAEHPDYREEWKP